MNQMYQISVVMPLRCGERKHTVSYFLVCAEDGERAYTRLLKRLVEQGDDYKHIGLPREMGYVQFVSSTYVTNGELMRLKGIDPPPKKPKSEPALNVSGLGKKQLSVLHSLREHKGWTVGCGWYWDTPSNTRRLMDGLVQRCLVNLKDGKYTINEHGLAELAKGKS